MTRVPSGPVQAHTNAPSPQRAVAQFLCFLLLLAACHGNSLLATGKNSLVQAASMAMSSSPFQLLLLFFSFIFQTRIINETQQYHTAYTSITTGFDRQTHTIFNMHTFSIIAAAFALGAAALDSPTAPDTRCEKKCKQKFVGGKPLDRCLKDCQLGEWPRYSIQTHPVLTRSSTFASMATSPSCT